MNFADYTNKALRTKSGGFFTNVVDPRLAIETLSRFEIASGYIDAIKKSLFYGKPLPTDQEVIDKAYRKYQGYGHNVDPDLLHAILGIISEAAEISEVVRESMGRGVVNQLKIKDEAGDLLWYLAILLQRAGVSFEDVLTSNIAKLQARFPDKFTQDRALNRDEAVETAALRG